MFVLSMPLRSIVMPATLRVRRTREPLAATSMFSAALEPLKASVSLPACPSTVSLPSPGSHWKVSLPVPSWAVSAPMLPSTKSLPAPPMKVSAPLAPVSVSSPGPPSMVTFSRAEAAFWTLTVSLPPRASTATAVNVARSKLETSWPLTITLSVVGSGASTSVSPAPSPVIWRVPAWMPAV